MKSWAMVILCNPLNQICLGCKKEESITFPKIVFSLQQKEYNFSRRLNDNKIRKVALKEWEWYAKN